MTTIQDPSVSGALVDWVNTFSLPRKSKGIKSLSELYDGAIISLILNDIDGKYFRDAIVKGFPAGSPNAASVNWVQRFNALKKLLRHMTDYYGDVLRTVPPNLAPDELPNLSSIAKERSIPDIVKFLRLVLALAVKSDKKEDYVQKIYTLSPETQKSLMFLLQQIVSTPSPGSYSGDGLLSEDDQIRFEQEIAEISAERDSIEKARLELLDEHESLKAESKRLEKSLEAAETRAREAEEAARSLGSKADAYLRSELERLTIELQDLEAKSMQKDTMLETKNNSLTTLTRQIEEMRPKAEAASRFEEELKETSAELAQTHKQILRLENILEKYKLKAEESSLLIRQNETLEEENAQMKESLRSRELVRSGSRGGLDASRMDADRLWAEEKNDLELEITRLKERLRVVEDQSSRDVSVIASLEDRLRESTPVATTVEEDLEGDDLNAEMSTTRQDLRLQVTRLERELAATLAELEFAKLAAKGDFETELRERFVKYETELSAANRKIADLTIMASQSGNSVSSSELRLRIDQLSQQVNVLEEDKQKLLKEKDEAQQQLMKQKDRTLEAEKDAGRFKSTLAALEGEAGGQTKGETIQLQKTLRELSTEVKFKDAEIQKQKDLLRKQDQKLKESKAKLAKATAGADQSLRDELSEVTKKLSVMKKSHQQEIALRNKELQMMASAFHDLGYRTQLNGFVVEKQSQGPSSFLAQQRNSIPSLSRKD